MLYFFRFTTLCSSEFPHLQNKRVQISMFSISFSFLYSSIDTSILIQLNLPSSTITTSCTSFIWTFSCCKTSSISVDTINKRLKLVEILQSWISSTKMRNTFLSIANFCNAHIRISSKIWYDIVANFHQWSEKIDLVLS